MAPKTAMIGVGNILEKDDGFAIYATTYLQENYDLHEQITFINGGVEGINLLNEFMQYEQIYILDTIDIDDEAGSIYHIPANELSGYGLNSGGAHEIGVMQCLDILELMAKPIPTTSVIGIVPEHITVEISLSEALTHHFERYIKNVIAIIDNAHPTLTPKQLTDTKRVSLQAIIESFKQPNSAVH